ncbi:polysaccharide biosynthesis protein [Cnuella takakiae]|nr:hypothetical protein [Cnuella takakiae]
MTQLVLVPFYLSYWSAEIYGVWIGITSLLTLLQILDMGHHNFLEYEFYKLAGTDKVQFAQFLSSGLLISILLGLLQLLLIYVLIEANFISDIFKDVDRGLIEDAGSVLLIQGITWCVTGSPGGLLVRALYSFGYLPRMGWWGIAFTILTSVAPLLAVIQGAGLLEAGAALAGATLFYYLMMFWDIKKQLRKIALPFVRPSTGIGWINLYKSSVLSYKAVMELLRQQGVRLILAPMVGSKALVDFATMRTGANTMLQGLGTITNPMMPELMKFLLARDQKKVALTFSVVWLMLMLVLAPGALLLQAYVAPLFTIWTIGKIAFDPTVFGLLSMTVLVYAYAQPSISIVVGNNLLKPQFVITTSSSVLLIILLLLFVPPVGIKGASAALLMVEIFVAIFYNHYAQIWLEGNSVKWPRSLAKMASFSVFITAVAFFIMHVAPGFKLMILFASLVILLMNAIRYLKVAPIEMGAIIKNRGRKYFELLRGR